MRLYLIRHPQPLVAPQTCYGRSDLGVDAAELARVADALRGQLPPDAPLYSSPLQRCALLADQLTQHGHPPPIRDARLAELFFGDWEMRSWSDIPRDEVDAWAADLLHYRPGGGENLLQAADRVRAFYQALRWSRTGSAVVVCHAGTIRLLQQCGHRFALPDLALAAANHAHKIGYGEVRVLDFPASRFIV